MINKAGLQTNKTSGKTLGLSTASPRWLSARCLFLLTGWTAISVLPAWSQNSLPRLGVPQVPPSAPVSAPASFPKSVTPGTVPPPPPGTLAPVNCDNTTLPLAPARPAGSGTQGLEQFAEPASSLQVPKAPAEVTITTTAPLTLEQSIELARRRNRDLQISALQIQQQREALREVRASIYPVVDTQAGITRSDSAQAAIAAKQIGKRTGRNVNRPNATNNFSGGVNLSYDVFTSGQRSASIRAAEAAIRSSEQAYQTRFQQLRLDVANDYYDLQQAGELIRIARQSVSSAEENVRVTSAREAAGIGTRFEVLQAEVTLADQRQQLLQAQSQQRTAQRQVAQRLSLPEMTTVTAADPVAMSGEWSLPLEDSIVGALQNRSELSQVLAQRTIAQQNRRVALGSLGPQLAFTTNIALADSFDDTQLGAYGYGLGVEVSKTIFDGGSAKAIAAQQQTNATIAETQFASFKNVIRFQIEQNFYTLQSSRERILTTRCAIEQARQGLRLAELRRDNGVGTSLEVSNATTDLAQAENNYLRAIIDYNRSLAALQRFVGERRR
jgi:outer membrane protein TolC